MQKIVLAAAVLTGLAHAQEIWVDPQAGSNANVGTYDMPLQTLDAAVAAAGPGARVMLLPGTYGPSFNGEVLPIGLGAANQQGIEIRGIGEPGDVEFDLAGSNSTVFRLLAGADGARITNITIRNTDQTGWWTRAINSGSGANSGNAANNVEIDRCRFLDINRGIVLWTSDNVTGWRIHDNLFVNCTNDAILEYTGTNDIFNNTFHTGTFKAYISDSTTSLCYNNLIVGYAIGFENNNTGSLLSRYQGNWLYQCTVIQQGAGMGGALPASNVIGTDPQLVNPTNGDFHVQAGSPTIDAGVAPPLARADLDAVSRLVDGDGDGMLECDIGCYEVSPLALDVTWDPQTGLMWFNGSSTITNAYGFVLFAFDDGLIQFPGQGPILLDQATVVPFTLQGVLPQQWVLAFSGYQAPPGQRLVTQIVGVAPNHVGSAVFGGNQVWTQF
ncbi:MAG: DUF1565 domain-containing protein [Planctomycetes bacterium]|nr:DUF1565 domain-containing protein [Planctomycetota bacterium]